ncbi:MAG: hypothetical protein LC624_10810 [Halobacteriales archaeon]|nr:hypothetical protein [Halobacteriales archaeon]
MVITCTAVLGGTLPFAMGGLDGVTSASMGQFLLKPKLDGSVVVECQGLSPLLNACGPQPFAGCASGCAPAITGTLGYTGRITATIRGFDNNHPPLPVFISQYCDYVAGNRGDVATVHLAGCGYTSDAPYLCPAGRCGYYMQGPFTLEGLATLPLTPIAKPVGPWTVEVVTV